MTYTGSFMINDAIEAAGENFADIGVFALPNVLGGPIVANYGPGEGWYVNAKSKNVDLAAQLLNHLFFTEASRKKMVEGGLLPNGAIDLSKVEVPSALAELLAEMNKYQKNGVVPTYLEGAAFDVLMAEVQKVLAGKATAKQLVDTVEKASIVAAAKADAYVPGIAPKC
jgi:ABC-type glycerol-3-phosphate transport system substrate-binding protein